MHLDVFDLAALFAAVPGETQRERPSFGPHVVRSPQPTVSVRAVPASAVAEIDTAEGAAAVTPLAVEVHALREHDPQDIHSARWINKKSLVTPPE